MLYFWSSACHFNLDPPTTFLNLDLVASYTQINLDKIYKFSLRCVIFAAKETCHTCDLRTVVCFQRGHRAKSSKKKAEILLQRPRVAYQLRKFNKHRCSRSIAIIYDLRFFNPFDLFLSPRRGGTEGQLHFAILFLSSCEKFLFYSILAILQGSLVLSQSVAYSIACVLLKILLVLLLLLVTDKNYSY